MNDTLDDILNESGDEEESDVIVNQVLEEIGIEIGSKVSLAFLFFFWLLEKNTCVNVLKSRN